MAGVAPASPAPASPAAIARRGFSRTDAGTPEASARRPTRPAPKRSWRTVWRRVSIEGPFYSPTPLTHGDRQAAVNVDLSATVGVLPALVAEA